jgi:hypothetical protein
MPKCFYPGCDNDAPKKACKKHADLYAKWTNNNYNRIRRCKLPELTLDEYIAAAAKWRSRMRKPRPEKARAGYRVRHGNDGMPTKALCPKCGNLHVVRLNWIGRGVPRVYCGNCKQVLEHYEGPEIDFARIYPPRSIGMAV